MIEKIGAKLRKWREKHGLNRKNAAKLLRIGERRIEKYEYGTRKLSDLAAEGLLARMAKEDKKLSKKR